VTFYYACTKSVLAGKNVCRRGCAQILTDSTSKRNRKDVLGYYNKTRINIYRPQKWLLDGIEGSVESSNLY
jgi:predicted nucleic acid-binding Zn ribbon protein